MVLKTFPQMKSANLVLQQYGAVGLSLSYSQNFRFFSENQNFSDLHITANS